jgi:hypothetical protein
MTAEHLASIRQGWAGRSFRIEVDPLTMGMALLQKPELVSTSAINCVLN